MKRTIRTILALAMLCLILVCMAACGGKTFDVTFMQGDKVAATVKVPEGGSVYPPELELDGEKVVGWYTSQSFDGSPFDFNGKITENTVLYAKIEAIKTSFSVIFMEGNKQLAKINVAPGERAYAPELEANADVTVIGWFTTPDFSGKPFDFDTAIDDDVTLYVKAVTNKYSVTYDLGGADGEAPIQDSVNLDASFTVKAPSLREGYRFLGWTDGEKLYNAGDIYIVSSKNNVVLTATWEYIILEVNFLDDNGNAIYTKSVPYGGDVIAPESIEHTYPWAYEFTGWSVDTKNVTENMNVNALFEYKPTEDKYFTFTSYVNGESYSVSINEELKWGSDLPENIVIPKEYNGKPVTIIDEEGFIGIDSQRLYVPGSIKTIKSVGIYQCHELTELVLEEGIERLETFAIASCYYLPSVTIPSTVNHWGFNVFYRCYELGNVSVSADSSHFKYEDGFVKSLDGTKLYYAVYGILGESVTIGEEVKWLAPGLFCDDNLLKEITINADLAYLGCGLFYNSGVETVTINGVIGEIHGYNEVYTKYPELTDREQYNMMPYGAFESTYSLKALTFKDGLKFIGGGAFTSSGITELTIPYSIEEIAIDAFFSNYSLEKITFTGDNTNAKYYADENAALIEKKDDGDLLILFTIASPLTEYTIPETVSTVNYYAFQNNQNLERLVISEGVFNLNPGCFAQMMSLSYVSIPSTVTELKSGTAPFTDEEYGSPMWARVLIYGYSGIFTYNTALTEIEYPEGNNITVIGSACFYGVPFKTYTISSKLREFASDAVHSEVLEAWSVEDGCTLDYSTLDGVLYNKEQSLIINYPTLKNSEAFTLPETVTELSANVFMSIKNLKSLTFNDRIEVINEAIVINCEALESIVLSANLKALNGSSIFSCPNLKLVEFTNETAPTLSTEYGEFNLFKYFYEDWDNDIYEYRLPEELVIKTPVSAYVAYFNAFYNTTGSFEYSNMISTEGQSLVTYRFDSKGGNDIQAIQAVILTHTEKPVWQGEDTKYFYGWYLKDGSANGEWGNELELPFAYTDGNEVTLYARWENTRLQNGKSWDTCFDLSENNRITFNSTNQTVLYFRFTATETGKLVDGEGSLPFHSEVLEALALTDNYRVWAYLYTQPEESYEYMIFRNNRYVTAGETYYMTLELYRYDGMPLELPLVFDIDFVVDTTKVNPN